MGVTGWELATIIQTPALVQSSFTTYTFKLLMVFQRRLIPGFEKLKRMRQANSLPHDASGSSSPFGKPRRFGGSGTSLQESAAHGYYHHGLKRYVYSAEPVVNGFLSQGSRSPPPYWEAVDLEGTTVT